MPSNKIKIDSYSKSMAAAATAEDLVADSGVKWRFAKEVIIQVIPSANTTPILVGNRVRQAYSLPITGGELRISSILNRMSQAERIDLEEIFVKAGTNDDTVVIVLIDPSAD